MVGSTTVTPGSGVRSVERSLSILSGLAAHEDGLRLEDLGELLSLPRSTIHRLLMTLMAGGFIERGPRGTYRLGLTTALIGAAALREREGQEPHSMLLRIREEVGETVGLATLDGLSALIVDRAPSAHPLAHNIHVGMRLPAHATSSGRVLLAQLDDLEVDALYPTSTTLQAYTRHTISTPQALRASIAKVREEGYAIDDQEFADGLRCVSVPVARGRGEGHFALGISGTASRLSQDLLQGHVGRLRTAADEIATLQHTI